MSRLGRSLVRATVFLSVLFTAAVTAAADQPTHCTDQYADCQDTCALRHGMVVRDAERLKLAKCIDKCKRVEAECRDQFFETQRGGLAEGALDSAKKPERNDDVRDEGRKPTASEDKPPPKKREEEPVKRTATRADELGANKEKKAETSSSDDPRYNLKFEEEKKAQEPAKKKDEPARAEAAPATAAAADDKPKPSPKKAETEEPKKKKKERALDEWDPEAL